jgi:hypothetical protein
VSEDKLTPGRSIYVYLRSGHYQDGEVLIAQRQPGSPWNTCGSFPGKAEPDKPEECIIERNKEEMDIDIQVVDIYKL